MKLIAVALMFVAISANAQQVPLPRLFQTVCLPDIVVASFIDALRVQAERIAELERQLAERK